MYYPKNPYGDMFMSPPSSVCSSLSFTAWSDSYFSSENLNVKAVVKSRSTSFVSISIFFPVNSSSNQNSTPL